MNFQKLLKKFILNFQNLEIMLLNDLRLFFRDKKSLILVLLTPFLILSVLVSLYSFSDVTENIQGLEIAICDLDNAGFDLESEMFTVNTFTDSCEQTVLDGVMSGEYRAAIIIPNGFKSDIEKGIGTELKVYLDNSKSTTAIVTSNAVKAYVEDMNKQIGTEFILGAWEQLRLLNKNLLFLVENLNKAIPVAEEVRDKMDVLDSELSTIDFESHKTAIDDTRKFLSLLSIELDYVTSSYSDIENTIVQIPNPNITETTSYLVDSYTIGANLWKNTVCIGATDLETISACAIVNSADKVMDSMKNDTNAFIKTTGDINAKIEEINTKIQDINTTVNMLLRFTDENSEEVKSIKDSIDKLDTALLFYEEKTTNVTETLDETKESVDNFLYDIKKVRDDLNQTIILLDEYTQKDPATILKPISVDTNKAFKDHTESYYKLPALLSIILMFITLLISSSLIVTERKGGTMARIFLSPLSMFFYVIEKMFYLLILCVVAIISMIIGAAIFGAVLPINLGVIGILLLSALVYISIGTFIGSMSKSENTSLLTCLVVSFPLMFMSGAFSPPELMDKFIRVVSTYLPLTLNVNLLEKLTLYNGGIDILNLCIMSGMFLIFYVLTVVMIKKNPTLK